jgi:hypothetical protein
LQHPDEFLDDAKQVRDSLLVSLDKSAGVVCIAETYTHRAVLQSGIIVIMGQLCSSIILYRKKKKDRTKVMRN